MKLVKNFVFAVLLASILAISVPAGEVQMPGAANPTPSPSPNSATSSDPAKTGYYGDSSAPDVTAETSDYLFFEALAALLSVY